MGLDGEKAWYQKPGMRSAHVIIGNLPVTRRGALVATALTLVVACSRTPPESPEGETGQDQQRIVESAARAFTRLRQNPRFASLDSYLERARAVVIFPHLVKASFILGGEGGSGVIVARAPDGTWSDPAFYSLGAPSIGFQIGVQKATVVLFIMDDATLQKALHSDLSIGANTDATLGSVGERSVSKSEVLSKPIYAVVESGGAFAGASLDGYIISARSKHNFAYYGPEGTPRAILIDRSVQRPEAAVLKQALALRTAPTPTQQPLAETDDTASATTRATESEPAPASTPAAAPAPAPTPESAAAEEAPPATPK